MRIYLHVFDRELRNFCNSQMSDKEISEIVLIACLLSDEVYVPFSNLMESLDEYPNSVRLVFALERERLCRIIASEDNYDSFMFSHQSLYRFVKDKYPIYYDHKANVFPLNPYVPFKDTTSVLRESLCKKIEQGVPLKLVYVANELHKTISNPAIGALSIDNIAQVVPLTMEQKHEVARLISNSYSQRYLDEICGTYIAELPYLCCLDDQLGYSTLRYPFYASVLKPYILNKWYDPTKGIYIPQQMPYEILEVKTRVEVQTFLLYLTQCVNSICRRFENNETERLRLLKNLTVSLTFRSSYNLADANNKLIQYKNLMRNDGIKIIEEAPQIKKVLLIVSTDLEFRIATQFYKDKGRTLSFWNAKGIRYYILGRVGNCEVHLTRTAMGAHGALGSIQTMSNAIEGMHPDYVIMVGIAYGIKSHIKMGDVLVSTTVIDADSGKETVNAQNETVFQSRGLNIAADRVLWQVFSTSYALMTNISYSVHTGAIISGNVVVDSPQKMKEIKSRFPNAIGGEMEGNGFLASPEIPWILVKAVCDKGENKSDDYQELAAHNAIEYVDYALSTL